MKPYSLNDESFIPKKLSREHTLRIREIMKESKDPESARKAIAEYANIIPEFVLARVVDGNAVEVLTPDTSYTFHHARTKHIDPIGV